MILPPAKKLWESNVLTGVCVCVCVCVCPQGKGGPQVTIIRDASDLIVQNVSGPRPSSYSRHVTPSHHPTKCGGPPWPCPLLVTYGGYHWRPVQTYLWDLTVQISQMVLTSGGHRSMYGWQVGAGMHLTRMFSCVVYFCCHV